jgi:acyl-CoA thioesterase
MIASDFALSAAGSGEWQVSLAERWGVGRNQNGGVLMATAAGALAETAGHPHPFGVTAHYLAAAEAGPATVRASLVKPGRTYATATGELWQDERERVRLVGAFGDLATRADEGPSLIPAAPPAIRQPEKCDDLLELLVNGPVGERALTRSLRNFEIRVDPDGGWGSGEETPPRLSGWIRYRDDDTVTPQMLLAVADGFPPTLLGHTEIGWLPTIELTVHVFGIPPADEPWLRAELHTRSVVGGLLDEDGELWDATGALVARFRQLALLIPRT